MRLKISHEAAEPSPASLLCIFLYGGVGGFAYTVRGWIGVGLYGVGLATQIIAGPAWRRMWLWVNEEEVRSSPTREGRHE